METREQAELTASRLIAQRETGPWSEQDSAALEQWLAESASHRVAYYRFRAAWNEAGRLQGNREFAASRRALHNAHPPGAVNRTKRFALAAAVLLAVGAATMFRLTWLPGKEFGTSIGALETIPMTDGSRIILNTDSRVRIVMTPDERRVELEKGEAFFEVAKDPSRPFAVYAGDNSIVAVGTQFAVRRERNDVRVSVTNGSVRLLPAVSDAGNAKHSAAENAEAPTGEGVLLPAGSVATAEANEVRVKKAPIGELEQRLTWRTGMLTFRDTALADAIAEFNRYNQRKIIIEDPGIAALQVGGIFRATNVDPFVHLLEVRFPIEVKQERDRILLRSR